MMHGRGYFNGYYNGYDCFRFFSNPWNIGIGIIIILIVAYIIHKLIRKNHNGSDRSLELLKMKYVSGEISEEEYIRRREILRK